MASRREFLGATAGAALAATVGVNARPARARQPEPDARPAVGRRIRKALKYGMIEGGEDIRQRFEMALEAGFEGVELDSPSNLDKDEVLRAIERTGIEVPGVVDSVHWNQPLSDPDDGVRAEGVAALRRAIEDCRDYGGSTVLLVPGVVNERVSYRDAWDRSIREIRRVLPKAREAGVSIAIENVWNNFLLGPVEAGEYLESFTSGEEIGERPVVGWYLDIGNIWHYGWPEHWIEALGPRILRLDIKGYSRAKGDREGKWAGFGVEIGDGDIPWENVRGALDAIGYRGWATAEVGGGGLDRLRDISARMDRVLGL